MPYLFYDLETFGTNAARDRIAEVAMLRTDDALELTDQPFEMRCLPPPDYLAHPEACLTTGITPQAAQQTGLPEPDFARRLERQFLHEPRTTIVGYNSSSFDDEFVRHLMYRNLVDPYRWHSRSGNRRLDFIHLIPALHDFHHEAFVWPTADDGRPDFRLAPLVEANRQTAGTAHEALADTFALRNLAALVRERTPEVWERWAGLADAKALARLVEGAASRLHHQPGEALLVYATVMIKREERSSTLVAPFAYDPSRGGQWLLWDLAWDPASMLDLDPAEAAGALETREAPWSRAVHRPNLRRGPLLFAAADHHRDRLAALGLDRNAVERHLSGFARPDLDLWVEQFVGTWKAHREERFAGRERDVEEQLYDGFIDDRDRRMLDRLWEVPTREMVRMPLERDFGDPRLRELAWRLRARYGTTSLTSEERRRWRDEVAHRLDIGEFDGIWERAWRDSDGDSLPMKRRREILRALAEHRTAVAARYDLGVASEMAASADGELPAESDERNARSSS